jgi:hypothetical protein
LNEKALEVFNELLSEWYWAEHAAINEFAINIAEAQDDLERRKKEFEDEFIKALK